MPGSVALAENKDAKGKFNSKAAASSIAHSELQKMSTDQLTQLEQEKLHLQ